MAENPEPNGPAQGGEQPQVKLQVLGQFIRDLSFENVVAQKGIQGEITPDVNVQVGLDAKKSDNNQFQIFTKYTITSKNKGTEDILFLLELDYGGIFLVENVPDEQLHAFLMIECPRMLFPFARRIVHDIIRDGGFPPLNLDNIDWVGMYRQNLMQQAAKANA